MGACMLLSNNPFPVERAAQLAIFGLALQASQPLWIYPFLQAPFVIFVGTGVVFELLHLLHKRRTKAMRNTWIQLERLRGQQDVSTLIRLMLDQKARMVGSALFESADVRT